MAVPGILPVDFEIGDEPRHEDEIDRTLAHHLIGDPSLAACRISGLGRFHGTASRMAASDEVPPCPLAAPQRGGRGRQRPDQSDPPTYQLVDCLSTSR